MNKKRAPVIVVGGGWAGIAAAIELTYNEIPVILLESAKQLGGRARSVQLGNLHVDNGQHLLLGAYDATLTLLRKLGIKESSAFLRQPLSLRWLQPNKKSIVLSTPNLPAPLHLAWGLMTAKGLSLRDRFSALKFSHAMQKINFTIKEDCSVKYFLQRYHQSPVIIKALWEPLCLAALNTQICEASAQLFLRTLSDSFQHARRDSDLLLTRKNLGEIFPEPALDYIETHHGSVRLGQRVKHLLVHENNLIGVALENEEIFSPHVILATPHTITKRLIKSHPMLHTLYQQIEKIEHRPICTVYVQYPKNVSLQSHILGSLHTVSQWIFDRGIYGQHGLMAVVISGDGEHMSWKNDKLGQVILEELSSYFPHWPKPLSHHVIREKRATFASIVNVNQYRPSSKTAMSGLCLAGDYTDVDLPATIEGAIRSGQKSAKLVARAYWQQTTNG